MMLNIFQDTTAKVSVVSKAAKQPKNAESYDVCDLNGKPQNGLRDNLRLILAAEAAGMEPLTRPIIVRNYKLSEIVAMCTQEVCIAMTAKISEKGANSSRVAPFFRKAAGNDKTAAKKSQKGDSFSGIDFSGLF